MNRKTLILIAVLVAGCSSGTSVQNSDEAKEIICKDETVSLTEDNTIDLTIESDWAYDFSDIEELKINNEIVLTGLIQSIDGISMTVATKKFSGYPYEYGNLVVTDVLQGNCDRGEITFARGGGVISVAEYEKYAPEEMVINDDKHRKDSGDESVNKENSYLNMRFDGDIEIEEGKSYLFFGNINEEGVFVINNMQYGSREIDENGEMLKNNETGEWESLADFMERYF